MREALVGDVGAGELPRQPAIDGAEERIAALGIRAQPIDMVEQPLDFGTREIGGQRQAGAGAEAVLVGVSGERAADCVGAGILPDDGVVIGLSGVAVPDNGGFALVGNADGGDFGAGGFGERGAYGFLGALPDFERIVLDPAGLRVELAVFELVGGDGATCVVEEHAAGAGGALVDGGDELGHGASSAANSRAICSSASPALATSIIAR